MLHTMTFIAYITYSKIFFAFSRSPIREGEREYEAIIN